MTRVVSDFTCDKVEQLILDWILTGRLRAGDKLPSLEQLTRDLGVGYPTVSKAVGRLRARRLVRADPGEGMYAVSLLEVAGLDLLWPMIDRSDEPERRFELLSQLLGFLRPLLADWADRAATTRTTDQLGWLYHYVLVLQDRRQLRCPRSEVGGIEYEIARVLAAAAGNVCFTLVLNPLEEFYKSEALVKGDDVLVPVEVYREVWEALRERNGRAAAKNLEAALWARESQCIAELRRLGWKEKDGLIARD